MLSKILLFLYSEQKTHKTKHSLYNFMCSRSHYGYNKFVMIFLHIFLQFLTICKVLDMLSEFEPMTLRLQFVALLFMD